MLWCISDNGCLFNYENHTFFFVFQKRTEKWRRICGDGGGWDWVGENISWFK